MKRIMIPIFIALFLGCESPQQREITNQLSEIDSSLPVLSLSNISTRFIEPAMVEKLSSAKSDLDSLFALEMSKSNRAKLNYLTTYTSLFLRDELDNGYINDSLINASMTYYRHSDKKYAYVKAKFFSDIIHLNNDGKDSLNQSRFLETLQLYKKKSLQDTLLLGAIYGWIGDSYKLKRDLKNAIRYHNLAIPIYQTCRDSVGLVYSKSVIHNVSFATKDTLTVKSIIQDLEKLNYSNHKLQSFIYSLIISNNLRTNNQKKVIEYLKRRELLNNPLLEGNLSAFYFRVSKAYYNIGQLDSAMAYARLSIKYPLNKQLVDACYSNIGRIYYDLNNYYLSSLYFRKAFEELENNSMNNASNMLQKRKKMELEKRYEIEKRDVMIAKIETMKRMKNIIFFSTTIILALLFFFNFKRFSDKKKNTEAQLKSLELSQQILKLTMSSLPKFTGEMNAIANRSAKHSKELFNDINTSISGFRANYRNNISSIVNSELFISQSPYLKYLSELSDQEKIILFFYEHGYSAHDISEVLGTTSENVRATKSRIKNKISSSSIPERIKSTLTVTNQETQK